MTAVGLPIALFTTFGVMLLMDASINLITMLGLIIVLGMLVDDGIIVAENVYRYIEDGMSPKEAAIKGTSEVMAPVTVTVLTTCAAFAPLLFMHSLLGKFIRFIPIVVMVALSASAVGGLCLPALASGGLCQQQEISRFRIRAIRTNSGAGLWGWLSFIPGSSTGPWPTAIW